MADVAADVGIRVDLRAIRAASCGLTIRSKRSKLRFRRLRATQRGRGSWSWAAASKAPTGNWNFIASCKKDGRAGTGTYSALIFTRNSAGRHGPLVGRSTTAIRTGRALGRFPIPKGKRLGKRAAFASGRLAYAANPFEPYYRGQCTWYAWSRRPDLGNATLGNAWTWAASAARAGFPVSPIPAPGTIAVWRPYFGGSYGAGHVAYVERVLAGNRIEISEYNWRPLRYSSRVISAAGLQFIYKKGQRPGEVVTPPPPFVTSLDSQFPMVGPSSQVEVTAGGPAVSVGYNVRFNRPFSVPNFVLRPDTASNINRFFAIRGDWPGARPPNDSHVGYYRSSVSVPAGTSPGTYLLRWNVANKATAQLSGLQPSFRLVVIPPIRGGPGSCPPPAPGGPFALSPDPAFNATLDAQFPIDGQGRMYVARGGRVSFGFNIRYSQTFQAQYFAIRTDTPGTINFFSDHRGDWYGVIASNDNRVGYYRAAITVPSCTPPGQYVLRWNVINMTTRRFGGLQPSLILVVQ